MILMVVAAIPLLLGGNRGFLAISDYRQSLKFQHLNEENKTYKLNFLEVERE